MSMITVKNLRKSFGKVEVLKDINADSARKRGSLCYWSIWFRQRVRFFAA